MTRCTRKNLIWIAILLGVPIAIYWYLGSDPHRYKVIEATIELVVEGEPVTIKESYVCEWRPLAIEISRPHKQIGPVAFAHRLKNGSGVIVNVYRGRCDDFPDEYYPSIYWFDNLTNPTYSEFHFSDIDLRKEDTKIRFISFSHEVIRRTALPLFFLFRPTPSIKSLAPWVAENKPLAFWGYLVQIHGLDKVDQETRNYFESNLTGEDVQEFEFRNLPRTDPPYHGLRWIREQLRYDPSGLCTPQRYQPYRKERCEALRQTYGIRTIENVGTFQGLQSQERFLTMNPLEESAKTDGRHFYSHALDLYGTRISSEGFESQNRVYFIRELDSILYFQKYTLITRHLLRREDE